MHMADALLSPAVGTAMCAVSAVAVAYSVKQIEQDCLCEKKIPVMGVMSAFVFAAQMINFTIPATGSSGHIGGGVLLAAMTGGFPALLSIAAVLIVQCLFFADGGLLALGCNIFNMGVIPCLIVHPLIFKPLVKRGITPGRIAVASIAAAVVGLQLGAFGVVLETSLSGIAELPFTVFALLMQPIHLAIGLAEGVITASVLGFVYKTRPEIIAAAFDGMPIQSGVPMRKALITLAFITLFVGGALSLFASTNPDGLEWSMEKAAGTAELKAAGSFMEGAAAIQEATAFMPDYDFKSGGEEGSGTGTTVAGLAGGAFTFLMAWAAAAAISFVKKKQKDNASASV